MSPTNNDKEDKSDSGAKSAPGPIKTAERLATAEVVASGSNKTAGIHAIGKITESVNQAEIASESKLSAAAKGHFDVLKMQSEKAETTEEREQIRKSSEGAFEKILEHDTIKSERRQDWTWKSITTVAVIAVGVVGTGLLATAKLIKR